MVCWDCKNKLFPETQEAVTILTLVHLIISVTSIKKLQRQKIVSGEKKNRKKRGVGEGRTLGGRERNKVKRAGMGEVSRKGFLIVGMSLIERAV